MGGETNEVTLVTAAGLEPWPRLAKTEVAEKLIAHFAGLL
jgi:phosphopantothenoylcysteine decarboxylase/phosphopantothenate--cysteine ligase